MVSAFLLRAPCSTRVSVKASRSFISPPIQQKAQSLLQNPKAGLYFYDRPTYRGVAFAGTVEVLHDQAIKDEVWRDMDTIFYESNTDPDYCVLKFTAVSARYYQDYTSTNINL